MSKDIILVDVDGPMANVQNLCDAICLELQIGRVHVEDFKTFPLHENLNTSEESIAIADKRKKRFFTPEHFQPVQGSIEAIATLDLFFEVFPGTARPLIYEQSTICWINRLYGSRKTYFASGHKNMMGIQGGETKLELGIRLPAKYIIEDNPDEIDHFAKHMDETGIIPICFEYPQNQWIEDKYPDLCRGKWDKILSYLLSRTC